MPTDVSIGGLPWKFATPEQAASAVSEGGKVLTPEQAAEAGSAQRDISSADANPVGELGLGVASGLTLGLAPGLLGKLGISDPGVLQAMETSPLYTGGDVLGTALPAILSGGESAAIRATPMGLADTAGSAMEMFAGRLWGDVPGGIGKAVLSQAAKGATEGALINLGHTVGDNLLENKPFAAEALAASALDGALFGGLLGGGVGAIGHGIGSLGDLVKGKVAGGIGRDAGVGTVAKSLGAESVLDEGVPAAKEWLRQSKDVLQRGGSDIGESESLKLEGAKKARAGYLEDRSHAVGEIGKSNPEATPDVGRITSRLQAETLLGASPVEHEALGKAIQKMSSRLEEVQPNLPREPLLSKDEWSKNQFSKPVQEWKESDYSVYKKRIESQKVEKGTATPLEAWVKARDALAADLKESGLGRFDRRVTKDALRIIDDEIYSSMASVDEALAKKYQAGNLMGRIAEELEGHLGKKYANTLTSGDHGITARDAANLAGMTAIGHPVPGLAWLASKGIAKQLQRRLEPAIADMAYNASIGTQASGATRAVRSKIGQSIKSFFKTTAKTAEKVPVTTRAEKKQSRFEIDQSVARTEQLLSDAHQEKVQRYAKELELAGYPDFANAILDVNHRASQYLLWNMPATRGSKQGNSLRLMPKSVMPSLEDYKFLRIQKGGLQPLSILDDLSNGTISRDTVAAVKYIYPELHKEIVSATTEQVYQMKASGETLPMDKISLLGVVLDAPIDSTLTPEYIGAVQASLATPPGESQQGGQSQGGPFGPTGPQPQEPSNIQSFLTPTQQTNFLT